jgi:ribosomal protein S11
MTDESGLKINVSKDGDHYMVDWDNEGMVGGSMAFKTLEEAKAFAQKLMAEDQSSIAVEMAVQAFGDVFDGLPPLTPVGISEVLYEVALGFMQNHHEAISILADAIGDAALRERDSAPEPWGETEGPMQ